MPLIVGGRANRGLADVIPLAQAFPFAVFSIQGHGARCPVESYKSPSDSYPVQEEQFH